MCVIFYYNTYLPYFMQKYLSPLMILFAAICKAGSDTLAHHFGRSIFKDLNPEFWNPEVSWKTAEIIFAYKVDAWHLFNSGMIGFFILGVIFYKGISTPLVDWLDKIADITILSFIFIGGFNTFYNHIFL